MSVDKFFVEALQWMLTGGHAAQHAWMGLLTNQLAGQKTGFLGDSITNRSTTTTSLLAYPDQTIEMLGTANVRAFGDGSVLSGHPGYRSDQIAPYLQSDIISAGCTILVTLQGTNDAGQLVPLDGPTGYAAKMLSQFIAAKKAGCLLYTSPSPRDS